MDLREICNKTGGLASEHMKSSKLETGNGGAVVQVMGVRNVSAPKSNEESKTAPRMLQFDLTDGQNVCLALEFESIQVRIVFYIIFFIDVLILTYSLLTVSALA